MTFSILSSLSIIPAALIAILRFNQQHLASVRVLSLLLIFKLLFEIIGLTTALEGINNMPFLYLYKLGETILIISWYWQLPYMRSTRAILLSIAAFIVGALLADVYLHWGMFIRFSLTMQSIFFALLCCWQFYKWIHSSQVHLMVKSHELYVSIAFFIYFGLNIPVYAWYTKLDTQTSDLIWRINEIFNLIANVLLFFSIFVTGEKILDKQGRR